MRAGPGRHTQHKYNSGIRVASTYTRKYKSAVIVVIIRKIGYSLRSEASVVILLLGLWIMLWFLFWWFRLQHVNRVVICGIDVGFCGRDSDLDLILILSSLDDAEIGRDLVITLSAP